MVVIMSFCARLEFSIHAWSGSAFTLEPLIKETASASLDLAAVRMKIQKQLIQHLPSLCQSAHLYPFTCNRPSAAPSLSLLQPHCPLLEVQRDFTARQAALGRVSPAVSSVPLDWTVKVHKVVKQPTNMVF